MEWVEKDDSDQLVSTPCYVQSHQPLDQATHSTGWYTENWKQ